MDTDKTSIHSNNDKAVNMKPKDYNWSTKYFSRNDKRKFISSIL